MQSKYGDRAMVSDTVNMLEGMSGEALEILLEADFLVNSFEDNLDKEAVVTFRDKVFKTKTGTDTLNTMFDI